MQAFSTKAVLDGDGISADPPLCVLIFLGGVAAVICVCFIAVGNPTLSQTTPHLLGATRERTNSDTARDSYRYISIAPSDAGDSDLEALE